MFPRENLKFSIEGRSCGSECQHFVIKSFIRSKILKMFSSFRFGRVPADVSIMQLFDIYLVFLPFTASIAISFNRKNGCFLT